MKKKKPEYMRKISMDDFLKIVDNSSFKIFCDGGQVFIDKDDFGEPQIEIYSIGDIGPGRPHMNSKLLLTNAELMVGEFYLVNGTCILFNQRTFTGYDEYYKRDYQHKLVFLIYSSVTPKEIEKVLDKD